MTTIAYRDGVIAADSQVTSGNVFDCTSEKIAQNERGDIAGAAGCFVFIQAFLAWFKGGEKGDLPKCPDEAEAFIVRNAAPERVECFDDRGHCVVSAPYYAVGSGKRVALGAMAFGADALQAVNCAIKHDIYTGGTVDTLKLPGAHWQELIDNVINPPKFQAEKDDPCLVGTAAFRQAEMLGGRG